MKDILYYLDKNVLKYPEKNVFIDIDNAIIYKQFQTTAQALACKVINSIKVGKKSNRPVAVFDNRNVNTLTAMFGVLYSGNYYVILDSKSPADRLQIIIDTLCPAAVIYEQANVDLMADLSLSCEKIEFCTAISEGIDEKLLCNARENRISTDPAYVLFTSGSTGKPKGTVVTHQNILSYIEWFSSAFKINSKTVFANQAPFYFSVSVSDIYSTVYRGATFTIMPKSYFAFPVKLVEFMNEHKVNTIYWVPSALCIVANLKLFDYVKPLYLKKVLFAGEIMPNKQLNYWRKNLKGVTFANLFGPTETTDICCYYVVDRAFNDSDSLPIGKHCDNCETFIVDANDREITAVGEVGELLVRGPFLASGYYDNGQKTDQVFVQNPLQNHYPEKVYRTGDLVKLNSFGEYEYVGRKDFQIKHKGYRIELGEIETNVSAHPKVSRNVCVFDAQADSIVLLYEGRAKKDELYEYIKQKVPAYMVPEIIIKMSSLPLNANGKIDRNYLKNNYKSLM